MKVSFVATVFNEEKNIQRFLKSIILQERKPDETIIVDGGSSDKTVELISKFAEENHFKVFLYIKKGNRSVGRNEGIKKAKGDVIAISDAGNILDKNWLKNITKPFNKKETQVVAGYYKGEAKNIFQKSLVPYALVMPDKVDEKDFLPATRSMAFRKNVWEKIEKFNEKYSHNEDYVFAKKLVEKGIEIVFVRDAIVKWIPRNNLKEAFVMFFRFSFGDAEAGIFRPKVFFIFYRYFISLYLFFISFLLKSSYLNIFLTGLVVAYILWSISKNYKYVKDTKAFIFLPLIQITSDIAVISGSILGLFKSIRFNPIDLFLRNKLVGLILLFYVLLLISLLNIGVPNQNHPFPYFMDEWHQLQSIRNVLRFGTPNIPGSANGSIFQFLLSGVYLIPFQLLGLVNLFSIKSSVLDLEMQKQLFEILRTNTLFFGLASVMLFAFIARKFFKLNSIFAAFLLIVNPVFILISNFFKYDVALVFWILLSFLFALKFSKRPTFSNYLLLGFFSGIAFSVKLSAIPLLPIYIVMFFIFTPREGRRIRNFMGGLLIFTLTFLLIGIPDVFFGKGNLSEYLTSVIAQTPNVTSYNYNFGMHYIGYLLLRLFPITFGHPLYYFSLFSLLLFVFGILKNGRRIFRQKNLLVLFMFFLFISLSLIPLKIEARGNRSMVLLPFMVLFSLISVGNIMLSIKTKAKKTLVYILLTFLICIQVFETTAWILLKFDKDPRIDSSNWIVKNIPIDSLIGIENIPLYQMLPDVVVKEFYLEQYKKNSNNRYKYAIINSKSSQFPKYIIVSNDEIEETYTKDSDKKRLIKKLATEKYDMIARFKPDFTYFKYFGSEFDFYQSTLIFTPNTISVYKYNGL